MKGLFRWLTSSQTGLWVLAGAFAVIGIRLFLWGLYTLRKGWTSKRWPSTKGKIHTSMLHEIGLDEDMSYQAEILYSYQLDGREYTGSKVFWGDEGFLSRGESNLQERLVEDYRPNQNVQIYYNPTRPEEAVLEPGSKVRTYVRVLFGVVLMLAAAFLGSLALSK